MNPRGVDTPAARPGPSIAKWDTGRHARRVELKRPRLRLPQNRSGTGPSGTRDRIATTANAPIMTLSRLLACPFPIRHPPRSQRTPRVPPSYGHRFCLTRRPITARRQINIQFFSWENADLGKRKRWFKECMLIGRGDWRKAHAHAGASDEQVQNSPGVPHRGCLAGTAEGCVMRRPRARLPPI